MAITPNLNHWNDPNWSLRLAHFLWHLLCGGGIVVCEYVLGCNSPFPADIPSTFLKQTWIFRRIALSQSKEKWKGEPASQLVPPYTLLHVLERTSPFKMFHGTDLEQLVVVLTVDLLVMVPLANAITTASHTTTTTTTTTLTNMAASSRCRTQRDEMEVSSILENKLSIYLFLGQLVPVSSWKILTTHWMGFLHSWKEQGTTKASNEEHGRSWSLRIENPIDCNTINTLIGKGRNLKGDANSKRAPMKFDQCSSPECSNQPLSFTISSSAQDEKKLAVSSYILQEVGKKFFLSSWRSIRFFTIQNGPSCQRSEMQTLRVFYKAWIGIWQAVEGHRNRWLVRHVSYTFLTSNILSIWAVPSSSNWSRTRSYLSCPTWVTGPEQKWDYRTKKTHSSTISLDRVFKILQPDQDICNAKMNGNNESFFKAASSNTWGKKWPDCSQLRHPVDGLGAHLSKM